jgi:hypothetical protein
MSKKVKVEDDNYNHSYRQLVESNTPEWRKERLMSSGGNYTRGQSWDDYNQEQKGRTIRGRASLKKMLDASSDAGVSDEIASANKTAFSLKRVDRFTDEDGVEHVNHKEVKQITPKPDGKNRPRNRPFASIASKRRRIVSEHTSFSCHELSDNITNIENGRLNKLEDQDVIMAFRSRYQKSVDRTTVKHNQIIFNETAYAKSRIEYIDNLLSEKFPKKEVTESEPEGTMFTMRGWLRAGIQKIIKVLELI